MPEFALNLVAFSINSREHEFHSFDNPISRPSSPNSVPTVAPLVFCAFLPTMVVFTFANNKHPGGYFIASDRAAMGW